MSEKLIKVSDYLARRLRDKYKVSHVFLISGGGAMHLNDSFGKQEGMNYICNHHEQASAIAAEGYARVNQELVVVNVTTGPGGLNTINGVFGQWTDSVPVLYVSGQVKQETTIGFCPELNLRQLGDQEADIISLVKPIVKYAITVTNPKDIKYIVDKAVYLATHGRFGPVWIDIPMDIQGALIKESDLRDYDPIEDEIKFHISENKSKILEVIKKLKAAKRPVIVAGHGIRLSKSESLFAKLIGNYGIPVVTTFNGFDVITNDDPNFIGRIGTIGQRAGNYALQNADVVLFLGTRNNIRQVSYNWGCYANRAFKIGVDIDEAELNKPTLNLDIAIHSDLKDFLSGLLDTLSNTKLPKYKEWHQWCLERKEKYAPENNTDYKSKNELVNPYHFILQLTEMMKTDDIAVAGNGTACVCLFQAGIVKNGQRIFWNSGDASMGYDLPAAIGACIANGNANTICLAGDGSIMMNLQELQTVKHYNLPIKIFILNNDGYISIRQTQTNFFQGRLVGSSNNSGVTIPDFITLSEALGIKSLRITDSNTMENAISEVLDLKEPVVCEVMLDCNYIFTPKLSSEKLPDGRMVSKPLEDMFPFLPRDEHNNNIL